MPRLRRGFLILLFCLPGTIATLFVVLAIANGGEAFGFSLDWLRNCGLLAVPMLNTVLVLLLMIWSSRERKQHAGSSQHEQFVSHEALTTEADPYINPLER